VIATVCSACAARLTWGSRLDLGEQIRIRSLKLMNPAAVALGAFVPVSGTALLPE
jgi:hypothetical protein